MREPVGFRDFVAARQNALLRSGWLLTGDWQRAEDLLQTSLAKVWPHWSRLVAAGDPEAYVRRVQVTTFLTWRRRRWIGEEPRGEVPDGAAGATGTAGRAGTAGTGDPLGCPVGTVKSQTARALDRLAALDVMEGIR